MTGEGSKQEILSRIAQTIDALSKLKTIMERQELCPQLQNPTDVSLVLSISLYTCETWTLTADLDRKI